MPKKILLLFYIVSYLILIALSLGIFYIFKPYSYVDNNKSLVICSGTNASYEIGPNFIYSFAKTLDTFNDVKARKICAYGAIKDYGNMLKTPTEINYRFEPKYIQESDWADTVFMFFATLVVGAIAIEILRVIISKALTQQRPVMRELKVKEVVFFFLLCFFLALPVFFFVLKKPAAIIFCKRQVARKVNSFKRIIFRYGVFPIPEEDSHIHAVVAPLYEKCLKSEG